MNICAFVGVLIKYQDFIVIVISNQNFLWIRITKLRSHAAIATYIQGMFYK